MQYTEGVKNFADKYDAHWLIDQILCLDKMMSFFRDEYHIWNLERVFVGGKRTTQFKLELLESDDHIGYTTVIRYTDFSEDHATFHLANNVLWGKLKERRKSAMEPYFPNLFWVFSNRFHFV